jgi:hypothetical protein
VDETKGLQANRGDFKADDKIFSKSSWSYPLDTGYSQSEDGAEQIEEMHRDEHVGERTQVPHHIVN